MICPKCGEALPEGATTCSFCGEAIQSTPQPTYETPVTPQTDAPVVEKPENVVAGTIGALIGSLIGGAAIILLFQMEIVAALGGLILAFCALKGYELLGGKLSTKGIIISVILMLIIPGVSYFLAEAISIMPETGMTLMDSVEYVFMLMDFYEEVQAAVIKNLLMIYGFTALGGFSLVLNAFKKKK